MSNIPVADAHCDFLYYMTQDGWDINRPTRNQAVALPYIKQGGGKLLFFAAWVDMDMRKDCLQQALDMFDSYFTMMEENDVFVPLTKDYTPDGDKIATVLTVEGGESLNAAISNVRLFHRLGVRAMTLTWNYSNELASPAMRRANKGLTGRGREVVREMNRIGIALDVSHLSDAGIDEAVNGYFAGPTAVAFGHEDAVAPAKVLKDAIKKYKKCEIMGGIINGTVSDAAAVNTLADLPSREVLLSRMLGSMMSPISGLAIVLDQIAKKGENAAE